MADNGHVHRKREWYGQLPVSLMHDKSITHGAARLFAHMQWRYGSNEDNHEGRASMAEFMGVSQTTITNWIDELVSHDWVVRRSNFNPATGRTTNFYHVFEDQGSCIAWQQEHGVDKPPMKERKLRKGVGGQPTHLDQTSTQVDHGSISTQVDQPPQLKLTNPLNSSSHDLDPYYLDPMNTIVSGANAALTSTPAVPISYLRSELIALDNGLLYMLSRRIPTEWHIARDSISLCGKHNRGSLNLMYHDESSAPLCSLCLKIAQEGPLATPDAVALPAKPKRGKQSANGAQKRASKERAPQPTDPAFDAVVRFLANTDTVTPEARTAHGWRVGQILHGDKRSGRCAGLLVYETERQHVTADLLNYGTLASDVDLFARSFRVHYPGLDLKDCVKFMEFWDKFRTAQAGLTRTASTQDSVAMTVPKQSEPRAEFYTNADGFQKVRYIYD